MSARPIDNSTYINEYFNKELLAMLNKVLAYFQERLDDERNGASDASTIDTLQKAITDIKFGLNACELGLKMSKRICVRVFALSIYDPYKDYIRSRDIDYFLKKDFTEDIGVVATEVDVKPDTVESQMKIEMFKRLLASQHVTDELKSSIFDTLGVLCGICKKVLTIDSVQESNGTIVRKVKFTDKSNYE